LLAALLQNNTRDLNAVNDLRAWSAQFLSTVEFLNYNTASRLPHHYAESIDHDAVSGAYKAWARGGISYRQSSVIPPDADWAYQIMPESASLPAFVQRPLTAQPGRTTITGWLRKDASMSWLPRVQLIAPLDDPLIDASNQPLAERVMTNSVNTWEQFTIAYDNETGTAQDLLVRVLAQNAGGNVYAYLFVTPPQVIVPVDRQIVATVTTVSVEVSGV